MEEVKGLKFGVVLRDIRTSRNMTVRDFSSTCSMSVGYISDLEKGNRKATVQVMNSLTNNLMLTEEEHKKIINAFAYDRLQIPSELLLYLVDNDLLPSLQVLKECDKEGTNIKKLAKTLKSTKEVIKR
jgi:transcriptional regulator with XRE-family HTH domain